MSADAQALADQLAQMQLAGAQGDGPTPPQLGPLLKGLGKGLWGQVTNAWDMARHPVDAATGVAHAVSHPIDTGKALGTQAWDTLTSGDPEQYGQMAGGLVGPGDIAKGLGLVSDAGKVSNIWGGAKAASHDPNSALMSGAMLKQGSSDAQVYDATGMYHTPKEWGQETPWHWIDDSKATILPGAQEKMKAGGATLADVMHPDWDAFKSYPGLRDMPVHYTEQHGPNVTGAYMPDLGEMLVGPGALTSQDELRKTIVHETQHAVQHFEQMPSGSSHFLVSMQGQGLQHSLDDERMPLPDKASVRELAGTYERAVKDGPRYWLSPGGREINGYVNTAGEVSARTAEEMLDAPRGTRPFELASALSSLPPQQQLVVGHDGGLFHPALKDADTDHHMVTGRFKDPEPDLSKRRPRK